MADGSGWDWDKMSEGRKNEKEIQSLFLPATTYFQNKAEETGNNAWNLPVHTGIAPVFDAVFGAGVRNSIGAGKYIVDGVKKMHQARKAMKAAKAAEAATVPTLETLKAAEAAKAAKKTYQSGEAAKAMREAEALKKSTQWIPQTLEDMAEGAVNNRAVALAQGRVDDVSWWDAPSVFLPSAFKAASYIKTLRKPPAEAGKVLLRSIKVKTPAVLTGRALSMKAPGYSEQFNADLDIAMENMEYELKGYLDANKIYDPEKRKEIVLDSLKKRYPGSLPKGQKPNPSISGGQ
jgi:hypothetical protein